MSSSTKESPPIPQSGPLSAAQSMTLCSGCVRCCTYVAVEVDSPDAPWMYDQYIWLLYHKNIWIYVERGNKWFVQFETVCDKLIPGGGCAVHGRHPALCKDYDPRECERRGVVTDLVARFYEGEDLVRWLEAKRPTHYRRWKKWFDEQHAAKSYGNIEAETKNGKPIPLVRFKMPPAPMNPLLARPLAKRVAYKKSSGPRKPVAR